MCHSAESLPPSPPEPKEVAGHGPLKLTSADGTAVPAYYALPAGPPRGRMVILPDVRGVHPYYTALAQRFAEAGFATVAVDYYGRTAGAGERDDSFDWQRYLPSVRPGEVEIDVAAALAHLSGHTTGPAYTVGFCFGGSQSWRLAASGLDLA
ncbi:dienelactone hydrolase family protein, partial [Amycolatopsis rhizosphaerae]